MPEPFSHFVFVDFENVQSIDLALVEGKPMHVTLLIGEKQKRLDLALVRQIHRHARQVSIIEVGASGRNALDLVLAARLGQSMRENSGATFAIISRDHDFDPLVAHFSADQVRITREPEFSALPIFGSATPTAAGARSLKTSPRGAKLPPTPASAAALRQKKLDGLVARLRAKSNRPKTRDSLLHHINTVFGQKLTVDAREEILTELLAFRIFTIQNGTKLTYST